MKRFFSWLRKLSPQPMSRRFRRDMTISDLLVVSSPLGEHFTIRVERITPTKAVILLTHTEGCHVQAT